MTNRSVVTRKTQIRPVKTQNGQVPHRKNAGEKPAKTAIKEAFVKKYQVVSEIHTIAVDSEKVILQLSTQENAGNTVKSSYTQSYPLYPHFFVWTTVIYITKKETNVL